MSDALEYVYSDKNGTISVHLTGQWFMCLGPDYMAALGVSGHLEHRCSLKWAVAKVEPDMRFRCPECGAVLILTQGKADA